MSKIISVIIIIIDNKEFIAILISFLGIVVPFWQYLNTKKKEQQQIEFANYHEKILPCLSNLYGNESLDKQIAIIYELRNYHRYYSVSIRILNGLKDKWVSENVEKRIIDEINLTLKHMGQWYRRK